MPAPYWSDPLHCPHHNHWYDQWAWVDGSHGGVHQGGCTCTSLNGPAGVPAARPTVDDMARFLNVDSSTPGLQDLIDIGTTEVEERAYCDPWTAAHSRAVLFVGQHYRAASNHAIGVVEGGDFGTVYMPRIDTRVRAILNGASAVRGGFA